LTALAEIRPKCIQCQERWWPREGEDATSEPCPWCREHNVSAALLRMASRLTGLGGALGRAQTGLTLVKAGAVPADLDAILYLVQAALDGPPAWVRPGARIEYAPSPGQWFAGTVHGEARLLGSTWVVHLVDMDERYRDGNRLTVPAASCHCLRPYVAARDTVGAAP
jgi:hypothetical protein